MKRNNNAISFCIYIYKLFWQKEKVLAFFNILSLILITGVILLFYGDNPEKCSFLYWIRSGMYGILCFSIFIGFLYVWIQSLEERKEDFVILHRIGVKKYVLVFTIQLETLLFQILAGICAILLLAVITFFVDGYEIMTIIAGNIRIQLEIQMISTIITFLYMKKR